MSKTTARKKSSRENSLDIIRGCAVFTMILAHVVAFFYSGNNALIRALQTFGDTVSFTLFLIVSGAATYFAYIRVSDEKWHLRRWNILKRLVILLLGYYAIAIISTLHNFQLPPSSEWIDHLLRIALFINIPGYTEFLVPFLFFGIFVLLFRKGIRFLLQMPALLIVISLILYFLGVYLYKIDIVVPLHYLKSIFAGHQNWYRFPILQYTPVFVLGLLIGRYLKREQNYYKRTSTFLVATAATAQFVLLAVFSTVVAQFPFYSSFQRWPPSLAFIALGILLAMILFLMLHIFSKTPGEDSGAFDLRQIGPNRKYLKIIKQLFLFWGKTAFQMYFVHIALLQIFNDLFGYCTSNGIIIIILFVIVLTITSLYDTIKPTKLVRSA